MDSFYAAFYLSVGIAVLGCEAYIIATREPPTFPRGGEPGRQAPPKKRQALAKEIGKALAQEFGGEPRLSDLGRVLARLGAAEAWGIVLSLGFTHQGQEDWSEMVVFSRQKPWLCDLLPAQRAQSSTRLSKDSFISFTEPRPGTTSARESRSASIASRIFLSHPLF